MCATGGGVATDAAYVENSMIFLFISCVFLNFC